MNEPLKPQLPLNFTHYHPHSPKASLRASHGSHFNIVNILENISPSQRSACIEVAELLKAADGHALLVGGCVRDGLLGIPAKDVDMEVYGLSADDVERTLKKKFRLDTVGRAFGVFIIKGHDIDLALPRRCRDQIGRAHV